MSNIKSAIKWDRTFSKNLIFIALPMVVQNLVSSILNIVDNLMVGRLGDAAHAGVSQALNFTFLFNLFLFGMGSGASIFIAQYWGRKEVKNIHRVMRLSFMATIPLAIIFIGTYYLFADQIILLFINDPTYAAFEQCKIYLSWAVIGFIFQAIDVVYATVLKATNNPHITMIAGIVSISTNVIANALLIFGLIGFPKLGVKGAAIATIISSMVSLAINTGMSYKRKFASAFNIKEKFDEIPGYNANFIKTVSPVIINEGLWALGIITYSIFYGKLGTQAMSAIGIFKNIEQITFVTIYGLMGASSVIIGQVLGTGDKEKAYLYAKRMLFASFVLGIIMGLTLLPLAPLVVNLFNIDPESKRKAILIIRFFSTFVWLRSINSINVVGILRSGGDTMFSLILDTSTVWGIGVPCVAISTLIFKWPVEYVFLTTAAESVVKAMIGVARMKSKKWINDIT